MQGGWLIAITGNPYLQVQTLGFTHISLLSEAVAFTSHTLECKLADIQFELYLSRSLTFFRMNYVELDWSQKWRDAQMIPPFPHENSQSDDLRVVGFPHTQRFFFFLSIAIQISVSY